MVETQHCKVCHHLSVTVQPFKVLPLSIPTYEQQNNIQFTLQHCLEKFGCIEKLYGSNGLHCKHCNSLQSGYGYFYDAKMRVPMLRKNVMESVEGCNDPIFRKDFQPDVGVLSPIQPFPDDQGTHISPELHLAKSSTPLGKQPKISIDSTYRGMATTPMFSSPQAASSPIGIKFHLTDGERQALISQLPDFLIIQLLRLTYQEGQPTKLVTSVSIPLSNLDLSSLCTERHLGGDHKSSLNGYYRYSLYAVVMHLGEDSITQGHYLVYAMAAGGSWFCFDDEDVKPVNIEYQLQTKQVRENACLLYYRKMEIMC